MILRPTVLPFMVPRHWYYGDRYHMVESDIPVDVAFSWLYPGRLLALGVIIYVGFHMQRKSLSFDWLTLWFGFLVRRNASTRVLTSTP